VANAGPAIAVFGAGRIGRVHAENVARCSGVNFAGVADVDFAAAERIVRHLGKGRTGTVESFLEDPAIDAVVIATPTDSHAAIVAKAAAAKKQIFCEKPISLDVDATIVAIEACTRNNVALQVGFQRRFDRDFLVAKKTIDDGALGEIRFVRLVSRDHTPPPIAYIPTSGGQYRDQMIHDFDAARWLVAPAAVEEVTAIGSVVIDPAIGQAGDVDTAIAVLRFSNGALCMIDVSREAAYGYDVRTEIQGSRGMFLTGQDSMGDRAILDASFLEPKNDSFVTRFADAYRREIEDFVDAVATHRKPGVGGDDALQALRIAIAADRSRSEHRTVALSEVAGG
jgi:myo-inositol 2-dehydrogenase / D-chiro-inositol 1-dehydrogenase